MDYHWNWSILLATSAVGDGTYLDWLLAGLRMTLVLSLAAWLLALAVGVLAGVLRTVPGRALPALATAYVEVFRNVPLLVQLFLWYFVLPELLPRGIGDSYKQSDPIVQQFAAATVCLGLFTGARVAEQVRAGLQALPPGQRNAGLALGLTLAQTYRHVLLPRVLRIMVPPLTSEMLNLLKNSSVCSTIGLLELTAQGRQLVDYTAQPYESFIAVTLGYLLLNAAVMAGMHQLQRRLRLPGDHAAGAGKGRAA